VENEAHKEIYEEEKKISKEARGYAFRESTKR